MYDKKYYINEAKSPLTIAEICMFYGYDIDDIIGGDIISETDILREIQLDIFLKNGNKRFGDIIHFDNLSIMI